MIEQVLQEYDRLRDLRASVKAGNYTDRTIADIERTRERLDLLWLDAVAEAMDTIEPLHGAEAVEDAPEGSEWLLTERGRDWVDSMRDQRVR